jgi:MoaA/NifB/PqqE/SkfB family radical SAM enzyme
MSELTKYNSWNFTITAKITRAYNLVCSHCTLKLQLQGHAQELKEEHVDF